MSHKVFITGTDTGVGKTVLTALLLAYLRRHRCNALVIKPFASGSHRDSALLNRVQDRCVEAAAVNPFYYPEPLAPLAAARASGQVVRLQDVVRHIDRLGHRAEVLLVEGCGGLLAPLGPQYDAVDLIEKIGAKVVVVAQNRLGVLNHALLTLRALEARRLDVAALVLMETRRPDPSRATNPSLLAELAHPLPVFTLPFLGPQAATLGVIRRAEGAVENILQKVLVRAGVPASVGATSASARRRTRPEKKAKKAVDGGAGCGKLTALHNQ